MVTLILAFIFLTPRSVFKDGPAYRPTHPNEITVRADGPNGFICELNSSAIAADEPDVRSALQRALQPMTGNVEVSRYDELRDTSGKLTGYRVWAHR